MSDQGDITSIGRLERLASQLEAVRSEREKLAQEEAKLVELGQAIATVIRLSDPALVSRIPLAFGETESTYPSPPRSPETAEPLTGARAAARSRGDKPARVAHEDMKKWCREILEEHGGQRAELPVKRILDYLQAGADRGYRVPGKKTVSNVSVHLARATDDFEQVEGRKGVWRLKTDSQ